MMSGPIENQKRKLSEIYIRALTHKASTAYGDASWEIDNHKIDSFMVKRCGKSNRSNVVMAQLKSTSVASKSMVEILDESIRYKLEANLPDFGSINYYLFLVVVSEPESDWINIDAEKIIMKASSYFLKLDTSVLKPLNKSPYWITIPKLNLLNENSILSLFEDKNNI